MNTRGATTCRPFALALSAAAFGPWSACRADAPHPPDNAVRQKIAEILARGEYQSRSGESWVLKWLADQINGFFGWLSSLYYSAPLLFFLFLFACAALLALLLAVTARGLRRALYLDPRHEEERRGEKRRLLSATFRQEATARAARGEYTEAIRFLFLALVYRYDESGRVGFQQAYTNREYLDLFADRPQAQNDLRVFVDALDHHWYGERPADAAQYERCLALYEGLR